MQKLEIDFKNRTKTAPDLKKPQTDAKGLIQKLDKYINRIKGYQNAGDSIDFSYGFWFAADSRALNRKANYNLALQLKEELERGQSIGDVFSNYKDKRSKIVTTLKLDRMAGYAERGVKSSELKNIIDEGSNLNYCS